MKQILMGPILYFVAATEAEWTFTVHALVVAASPDAAKQSTLTIRTDSGEDAASIRIAPPEVHADFSDLKRGFWIGWQVSVGRTEEDRVLSYEVVSGQTSRTVDDVVIPKNGALPRIAFFSCNGAGEERKFHDQDDPYGMWTRLTGLHESAVHAPTRDNPSGFHLLIGGGDQIYADSLWEDPPLKDFRRMSKAERKRVKTSPTRLRRVMTQYVDLYIDRWSKDEVAWMKSRVPGIFSWDDHDIFDGWGSLGDDLIAAPLYQEIFTAARRAFRAFQLGSGALLRSSDAHAMQGTFIDGSIADLGIVLLDTRTDRLIKQILSAAQWKDLKVWLGEFAERAAGKPRHLLLVSAVPVVYLQFHFQGVTAPMGVEDDRRDGWEHNDHRGERKQLIMTLLDASRTAECQTTILSGDVHVAARGRIVSANPAHLREKERQRVVHQLTSSAIGHPEPKLLEWLAIQAFTTDAPQRIDDAVHAETISMQPGERFIRSRNFLTIAFDDEPHERYGVRMWAQWYTERDGALPEQEVIGAVG